MLSIISNQFLLYLSGAYDIETPEKGAFYALIGLGLTLVRIYPIVRVLFCNIRKKMNARNTRMGTMRVYRSW